MGPCIPELCGLMAMLAAYLSCVVLRPCWGRSAALIPYAGQWHHWSLGVGIEGGGLSQEQAAWCSCLGTL
jgi:hypothetical protein